MAVWNVINLHEIKNKLRIEAEFYRPDYVVCYKTIERLPHIKLRPNSLKISDGTHFTPRYTNDGVKFYSAVNVKEGFFAYDESFKFISAEEHRLIHKRCPVQSGDILLRKVGVGPRWSCVVPGGLDEFSIFVSVALVRPNGRLLANYLSTFINCQYGQLQLLRLNKGISQPDLHLEDIGELIVPEFTPEIQFEISHTVEKAIDRREDSKSLYTQAQQLLEAELGLDKLRFDKPVGYTARFSTVGLSDTFFAKRIDSQCFAPDALFYEKWLRSHVRCDRLGKLLHSTAKGHQQAESPQGNCDYCSIKHISGQELVDVSKCFPGVDTPVAETDDLLLAITGATIGKIGIVKRYTRLAFSGDLLMLRAKAEIDPSYLLLVLDHRIGQVQFFRWITGSTNGHLAPRDAGRVLVPRLDESIEEQIAQLVEKSISRRLESEQLLAQAKTRVEQLIQEGVKS